MKPVRVASSNAVYRGPNDAIGDLWCERVAPGHILVVYEPDDDERAILAAGGRVELALFNEPIPPISIGVVDAEASASVGEHGFRIPIQPDPARDPAGAAAMGRGTIERRKPQPDGGRIHG
ncbi:MAG: hypothetical protein ACJ76I_11760 [Gaiellaceae bacterium]